MTISPELLYALAKFPIHIIFIIVGFAFLILGNGGSLAGIESSPNRGSFVRWIGILSVLIGTVFYLLTAWPTIRTTFTAEENKSVPNKYTGYTNLVVTRVAGYSQYGGGDVSVKVNKPTPGCDDGFWIRPTDPGFETILDLVTSSLIHNRTVYVYALQAEKWAGTRGKVCRVYNVYLQ